MKKKYWKCALMVVGAEGCDRVDTEQPTHCVFHEHDSTCIALCNSIGDPAPEPVPCVELELTEAEYKGYLLRWALEGWI